MASLGVKWRFVDDELFGVAISSYPRIDFHQRFSSEAPVVNTPGTRYFLPIEFSKELGAFGINPEIGFASYTQFGSEWVYGLAMSYIHLQKKKRRYFRFMGARSSVLTTANYFSILELAIY